MGNRLHHAAAAGPPVPRPPSVGARAAVGHRARRGCMPVSKPSCRASLIVDYVPTFLYIVAVMFVYEKGRATMTTKSSINTRALPPPNQTQNLILTLILALLLNGMQ